jgi:hypothetical protein
MRIKWDNRPCVKFSVNTQKNAIFVPDKVGFNLFGDEIRGYKL